MLIITIIAIMEMFILKGKYVTRVDISHAR